MGILEAELFFCLHLHRVIKQEYIKSNNDLEYSSAVLVGFLIQSLPYECAGKAQLLL